MGKFQELPIGKIKPSNNPNRAELADLGGLMRSIKQDGILNPPMVQKRGVNFELVHGHRRLAAAKKLGWKTIEVQVVGKLKDKDAIVQNYAENVQRRQPSLTEEANTFIQLRKMKMTNGEIAARLGLTPNRVKMSLTLWDKVPTKFKDVVQAGIRKDDKGGKISYNVAYHVLNSVKRTGVTAKAVGKVWQAAADGASKPEITALAKGFSAGVSEAKLKKEMGNIKVHGLTFSFNKRKLNRFEKDMGLTMVKHIRKLVKESVGDILT
jgi:ParB family chromosome partitioning protein